MSNGLPHVSGVFTLAKDPELRFSQSGNAILTMRCVANEQRYQDGKWEQVGAPLFIDVTAFKKLAENVAESVVKGDRVLVSGSLRNDQWTTREGETRDKLVIIADAIGPEVMFGTARTEKSLGSAPPSRTEPVDTSTPPF